MSVFLGVKSSYHWSKTFSKQYDPVEANQVPGSHRLTFPGRGPARLPPLRVKSHQQLWVCGNDVLSFYVVIRNSWERPSPPIQNLHSASSLRGCGKARMK